MKLSFACDHGGIIVKDAIISHLVSLGHEVVDCGTYSDASCNYPEFAFAAAIKVASGEVDKGILVCSSGEGISIAANKVKGIRCGIGYNDTVSQLLVEHNHANMIAFGAKYMSEEEILHRIDIFLNAEEQPGRHQIRVAEIETYEKTH
jgi:sugar-phosphate isomerase, RpiB/LacA/LacB family